MDLEPGALGAGTITARCFGDATAYAVCVIVHRIDTDM